MKSYLLLSFLFGLAACSAEHPVQVAPANGPGIIGGQEVPPASAVAQSVVALVGNDGENQFLCTGVLIAPNTVLTAAHCGVDLKQGELIFSTDLSTADESLRRPVESVQISPQFAGVGDSDRDWGDLSVMQFSGAMPAGYAIAQIGNGQQLSDGDTVVVAGFGVTDGTAQTPSQSLRAVEVHVQDANYSEAEFSVDQSAGAGVCHGDSGGPAFAVYNNHLYLVGITSRGSDAECAELAVETKVSPYVQWIESVTTN